jgi:hypothetical protein
MAGGLPEADKAAALARAQVDRRRYLTVSIDIILIAMAARRLIPAVQGLSPLEAADLTHAEAQFLAKRLALRAVADGRDLLLDISMASPVSAESWLDNLHRAGYTVTGVFAGISIEESMRRSAVAHRRGQEEYRAGRGYGGRYIPPEAIRALADTRLPATITIPASGIGGQAAPPWWRRSPPGTPVPRWLSCTGGMPGGCTGMGCRR